MSTVHLYSAVHSACSVFLLAVSIFWKTWHLQTVINQTWFQGISIPSRNGWEESCIDTYWTWSCVVV